MNAVMRESEREREFVVLLVVRKIKRSTHSFSRPISLGSSQQQERQRKRKRGVKLPVIQSFTPTCSFDMICVNYITHVHVLTYLCMYEFVRRAAQRRMRNYSTADDDVNDGLGGHLKVTFLGYFHTYKIHRQGTIWNEWCWKCGKISIILLKPFVTLYSINCPREKVPINRCHNFIKRLKDCSPQS